MCLKIKASTTEGYFQSYMTSGASNNSPKNLQIFFVEIGAVSFNSFLNLAGWVIMVIVEGFFASI